MNITDDQLQTVVQNVIKRMSTMDISSGSATSHSAGATGQWGVFNNMNDAIDAADKAFGQYCRFGLQDRKTFVDAVRKVALDYKEEFSRMAVEQTGMGRVEHKIAKHINVAKYASGVEFLQPESYSGANGLALDEYAPWGVIGNISPSTHPSPTMLENIISQLSGGNTIVFNPHPGAKRLNAYVIQCCNKYIVDAGGPENLVTCVAEPTLESAQIMFEHPVTRLLSVTGGPAVVQAAMKCNKTVLAAGPGNPPVLIDETADLALAAKEITASSSFDNNILCIGEKQIFVVDSVFDQFMRLFENEGNRKLIGPQMDNLASKALSLKGKHYLINRDFVGKSASVLAKAIGINISDNVPMLFGETDKNHPWVLSEQMTCCIPVIRVPDFKQGVEIARHSEHYFRHTASVFTQDMNRATEFSRRLDCSIVVINGGTLRGNGGDMGQGTFSHTIASPTGQGITNPRDFCRRRRIMTSHAMRFV
ncbi:MAG: aldehyde dehydrogenase [Phycisphaerae bacterium]|nr:aldehyde dehydrogenase [Phycisphaerae bacterium]